MKSRVTPEDARLALGARRFEKFVPMLEPAYLMGWAQLLIARKLEKFYKDVQEGKSPRLMIFLLPRHPLADDTPVFTPSGWTTHGCLKPGDYVFGVNGYKTKVIAVSEPAVMTHRVMVGDEKFDCGPGHLWPIHIDNSDDWVVKETEWLAHQPLLYLDGGCRRHLFRVPERAAPPLNGDQYAKVRRVPITYAGELPKNEWSTGRCIEVEREDGLYLVGHSMVPTHNSKSLTVSQLFPPWVLGQDPTLEIVVASYGMSLPAKFSRRVREIVRSDATYQKMFPDTRLHSDIQAVEEWETTLGGGFRPVGRGGPLTGKGAHILIVDDILKDAEEADSPTVRETAHDWYSSTAYTRLYPGGGVIIVMTRWHVEDLAGVLVTQMEEAQKAKAEDRLVHGDIDPDDIDSWDILKLPAIAEQREWVSEDSTELYSGDNPPDGFVLARNMGEALHPERYSLLMLKRIQATQQPRHWQALYQQQPMPEGGAFFEVDSIRYGSPPMVTSTNVVIAADTAASTDQSADESCIMVMAMDAGRNVWVLDCFADRVNVFAFVDTLIDMYVKFPEAMSVGIEAGPLREAIMPLLEQRMLERGVFMPLADKKEMRATVAKDIRARPLQGVIQTKRFWLPPAKSQWVSAFMKQLKLFPQASHDDMVDAAAWGVRLLLSRGAPLVQVRKPVSSWKDRLNKMGRKNRTYMGG